MCVGYMCFDLYTLVVDYGLAKRAFGKEQLYMFYVHHLLSIVLWPCVESCRFSPAPPSGGNSPTDENG